MQKNNAVFHRGQEAVLLRSALLLRMTPNHAHHPTVIADAGKQLTTTLTISELEQKCLGILTLDPFTLAEKVKLDILKLATGLGNGHNNNNHLYDTIQDAILMCARKPT